MIVWSSIGRNIKYRMNGNSAKFYDKAYSEIGRVLRGAETTINTVQDLRAFRPKEGGPEEAQKDQMMEASGLTEWRLPFT